jgi:hypothetical protein
VLLSQYVTRTRYFSVALDSAATGTWNSAAHAAVFFHSRVDRSISQVPPTGSFTDTTMRAAFDPR